MNRTPFILSQLTPSQQQALYEHVRRQTTVLRREAMRDAAAWIAGLPRALWRAAVRAVTPHAAQRTPQAPACPR